MITRVKNKLCTRFVENFIFDSIIEQISNLDIRKNLRLGFHEYGIFEIII